MYFRYQARLKPRYNKALQAVDQPATQLGAAELRCLAVNQ
jgi:hypothetical protein